MSDLLKSIMLGCLLTMAGFIFGVFLCGCSFDYDNDYINKPPDSIIGTSCNNENETRKYEYGDYYYCAMCLKSADGLAWFEVNCNED